MNKNEDLHYLTGDLKTIFFENDSNYYKVMLIDVHDTNMDYNGDEIVITGNFGRVKEDTPYQFYGQLVNHPKYGLQMKCDSYEQVRPTTKTSLIDFLSGSQFKGIGKVTATNIVNVLGEAAIEKILEDPTNLDGIQGLTEQRKESLLQTLQEDQGLDQIVLSLNKYGITNSIAYKIYEIYGEDTLEEVFGNPYQLVESVDQISFAKADAIAEELGIEADARERLRAALIQSLKNHCFQTGDTYILENKLLQDAINLLEKVRPFIIDPSLVEAALSDLIQDRMIIKEEEKYYLLSLYSSELSIASHIRRLTRKEKGEKKQDLGAIKEALDRVEKDQGFAFGPSQKAAILDALSSPVFILTGGPGTGKTTVVNGIVKVFADLNDLPLDPHAYKGDRYPILLAAPTGRAAKRMSETTDLPSGTIHRLLGLGAEEDQDFLPSEDSDKLKGQLLIIDEMSMVDTWLFNHLLAVIPDDMQLVLVGDKDQLPSVGPGQVFSDLIDSQKIPLKELTEIYRQESDSSIPFLAAQIKKGELAPNFTQNKTDRTFIPCSSRQVVSVVSQVADRALTKGVSLEDIQVLAPMYRGPAGIDTLNEALQEVMNPNPHHSRKEIKNFETTYRVGDKVLQLTNEPDRQIFNGDIGIISSINLAEENPDKVDKMTILFDEIEVEYQRSDFNKISLAYCLSIHKAQGSEFQVVILPYVKSYYRMLRKDLLYTAITRTSQWLILCGEEEAFYYSLQHSSSNRKTSLLDRLQAQDLEPAFESLIDNSLQKDEILKDKDRQVELSKPDGLEAELEQKEKILTPALVASGSISPMIGMGDWTPYDEIK